MGTAGSIFASAINSPAEQSGLLQLAETRSLLDEQIRHLVQTTEALQTRTTSLTTALKGGA